jgi:hypothetical protein
MLPSKRGGEKERESMNKQTYLLCFLKKEGDRDRMRINRLIFCVFERRKKREGERVEEEGGVRETLAPPFTRVFKTDPTLVIYKILEKTLIL